MSDTNNSLRPFDYAGVTLDYGIEVVKARTNTKTGKTSKESKYITIVPRNNEDATVLLAALLDLADKTKAGNGLKLFCQLIHKKVKDAFSQVVDTATGDWEWDDLFTEIAEVGRQSIDLDALSKEIMEEFGLLTPLVIGLNDDETTIAEKTAARAAAGISDSDEFARRFAAVNQRYQDYLKLAAEAERKNAERAEKMKAGKAAKKAAAEAAKANTPAAEPAN